MDDIRDAAAKAAEQNDFFRAHDVLLRRRKNKQGDEGVERLVRAGWVSVRPPRSLGQADSQWETLNEEQLCAHVRKYFFIGLAAEPLEKGGAKKRWTRGTLGRMVDPPLRGGSARKVAHDAFERSREAFTELLAASEPEVLDELKEQALLGYEHQRQRIAAVEQRANFFLGAAGLTTSLVLANAGLLLGSSKLEATWQVLAAVALAVASVCAIAAGLRALQATMITFYRAPPNGVPRIMKRRKLTNETLLRTYIAALLVGQYRLSVIAEWKIGRMKDARRWFLRATLGVVVLTGFVLANVLADPGAGVT